MFYLAFGGSHALPLLVCPFGLPEFVGPRSAPNWPGPDRVCFPWWPNPFCKAFLYRQLASGKPSAVQELDRTSVKTVRMLLKASMSKIDITMEIIYMYIYIYKYIYIYTHVDIHVNTRHKETHRDTQRHKETHRDTRRHTETHRDTRRHTETHRDAQRHTDTQTHRHTDTQTHTHTDSVPPPVPSRQWNTRMNTISNFGHFLGCTGDLDNTAAN
jgi:hypothetical protein